jgi:hypothetical protein
MQRCFAWCASAFAWATGCCARMAWAEPPVFVCPSACCNHSSEYLESQLEALRQHLKRRRTI